MCRYRESSNEQPCTGWAVSRESGFNVPRFDNSKCDPTDVSIATSVMIHLRIPNAGDIVKRLKQRAKILWELQRKFRSTTEGVRGGWV